MKSRSTDEGPRRASAVLSVAVLLGLGASMAAAQPDAVRAMLDASGLRETIAKTYAECEGSAAGALAGDLSLDEQRDRLLLNGNRAALEELLSIYERYFEETCNVVSQDDAYAIYEELYGDRLTAQEIEALLEFYRSPLGRKAVAVDLAANAELQERFTRLFGERSAAAQQTFERALEAFWLRLQSQHPGDPIHGTGREPEPPRGGPGRI